MACRRCHWALPLPLPLCSAVLRRGECDALDTIRPTSLDDGACALNAGVELRCDDTPVALRVLVLALGPGRVRRDGVLPNSFVVSGFANVGWRRSPRNHPASALSAV